MQQKPSSIARSSASRDARRFVISSCVRGKEKGSGAAMTLQCNFDADSLAYQLDFADMFGLCAKFAVAAL